MRCMSNERRILVTAQDMHRLQRLIEIHLAGRNARAVEELDEELSRAVVVAQEEIPRDVVTMNSRVVFEDQRTGRRREVTLVYPHAADPTADKVSVFAPVGAALLGLAVGQSIDWPLPDDRTIRLRIVAVVYQPEASGDLHL